MSKKRARSRSSKKPSSNKDKGAKKHPEPFDHWKRPRLVEGEERKVHEEIIERRLGGGAAPTDGEERKVHEEIIERRLGGGAAPTEEAYARALKQWQELPGSVIRPPTDVTLPVQKLPKSQDTVNASDQTHNDK
jgi:hypothetical protein